MRGVVSGGAGVLLAHASQGQIAATHETLSTGQEVADLRTQLAIRRPARAHGISAEQGSGNVAMVSTRLRRIKRLQRVQVQQGRTGNFSGIDSRPFPLDGVGLHLETAQSRAQVGIERNGQAVGRTVLQLSGQQRPQTVRPMLHREAQFRACMRQMLATGNLP